MATLKTQQKLGYSVLLFIGAFLGAMHSIGNIDFDVLLSNDKNTVQPETELMSIPPSHKATADRQYVKKIVLDNGLTILIRESHEIPKVAFEIWYNVGSKDELLGEKGIAHLIEHMIFKGTDTLSESDIKAVVHKLSGHCNAYTSYDWTRYVFEFPTQHWREAFPIVADCMTNCSFKDDMLNSEMKVVIQELKMNRDNYERSLREEMMGALFADHPYHYPIIGYKHDLWTVSGKDLLAFYKKHYTPNNATLVVVGDVNTTEVVELAQKYFGNIPNDSEYVKKTHFCRQDIVSKSVTLYRDIAHPIITYAFIIPGASAKIETALDIFNMIFSKGKSSRLYKKLVNQLQLATDVDISVRGLFDQGILFIDVEPKKIQNAAEIERVIAEELEDIAHNGFTDQEFERGLKKMQMGYYTLLESIKNQAYLIGNFYLANGDENYVFTALEQSADTFKQQIQHIVVNYLRPTVMHKGFVLPLPEKEKGHWLQLQEESDVEDQEILAVRKRLTPVEPPSYATTIEVQKPTPFDFPKPQICMLSNGLKVFYHNNDSAPIITIDLELKANQYYDPEDHQGLCTFMTKMMTEGTENYTSEELADATESRGMSIDVYPNGIIMKMLSADFEFGLGILKEILTHATFPEDEIEKIRQQLLTNIKQYWDEPQSFIGQLVREEIYHGHPYHKRAIGTAESIATTSRNDLISFYEKYISPSGARLAIVGDLQGYDVPAIVEKMLGDWPAREVKSLEYPLLAPVEAQEINYPINRDQAVLCLAQLSIARKDPKFDAYLLFDQIFSGGALDPMSSRLFKLREHTGLFYAVWGSLLVGIDEQPRTFQVRTIVSLDKLAEAEKAIKETIDTVIDTLTQEELEEAKRAVINTLVDNFASNGDIAATFLFLDRFNLPADYFDNRAAVLEKITLEDMKNAVRDILNSKNMITLRVGRV